MALGAQPDISGDAGLAEARAAVERNPAWYHTLELAPGVVTPGYFDLRAVRDKLPWPDVRGKRCLDVGSFDGFYSFELERRGAAEVVAVDVEGPEQFDWPPRLRDWGQRAASDAVGGEHAAGFDIAKRVLGSSVERVRMTIYDVSPERLGEFDVVTCGSLLLHLRDPHGALQALRSVCRGQFLSADEVDARLSVLHPRRPMARLDGETKLMQWWIPNAAGHRRMVTVAGFAIESVSKLYAIPFGPAHASYGKREWNRRAFWQRLAAGVGVPHQAVLARAE